MIYCEYIIFRGYHCVLLYADEQICVRLSEDGCMYRMHVSEIISMLNVNMCRSKHGGYKFLSL